MIQNVQTIPLDSINYILCVAHKRAQLQEPPAESLRCRFELFVRMAPGNVSNFKDQQRTWCYRGDKYTTVEAKMIRNLINLADKRMALYDRVVLYDNDKSGDERVIFKVVDGVIEPNRINLYSLLFINYPLPRWLSK